MNPRRTRATALVLVVCALVLRSGEAPAAARSDDCPTGRPPSSDLALTSTLAWYAPGPDWPIAVSAVADIVVAAGMAGDVGAYDAGTGDIRWVTPLGAPTNEHPQIGSTIVAVAAGRTLFGLDRQTGAIRWQRAIEAKSRLALVRAIDRDTVVIADARARFSAVDLATGSERWIVDLPMQGASQLEVHASTDAVVASVVGHPIGRVNVVLDPANGSERWRVRARAHSPAPILTETSIVVPRTGRRSELVAHDSDTGAVLWRRSVGGRFVETLVPAGDEQHIAVLDTCGTLSLLEAGAGDIEWQAFVGRPPYATYLKLTATQVMLSSGRRFVTVDRQSGVVSRTAASIVLNDLAVAGDKAVLLMDVQHSGAVVVLDRKPFEAPQLH